MEAHSADCMTWPAAPCVRLPAISSRSAPPGGLILQSNKQTGLQRQMGAWGLHNLLSCSLWQLSTFWGHMRVSNSWFREWMKSLIADLNCYLALLSLGLCPSGPRTSLDSIRLSLTSQEVQIIFLVLPFFQLRVHLLSWPVNLALLPSSPRQADSPVGPAPQSSWAPGKYWSLLRNWCPFLVPCATETDPCVDCCLRAGPQTPPNPAFISFMNKIGACRGTALEVLAYCVPLCLAK